jgi:hypothetical protein
MSLPITGRCFCGAIRFRRDTPPVANRACWCRDCQFLSSGNASINLIFPKSRLTLSGTPAHYESTADSGNVMRRSFCPTCGTPLFSESSGRPDYFVVRAGVLDEPNLGRPASIVWTASAPAWSPLDPDLPSAAGQRPVISDPPA